MIIRPANPDDIPAWSHMRTNLWPDSHDQHLAEINAYFAHTSIDIQQCFVIETDGQLAGFIELNIRNFVEGSRMPQVPYVEAWYVEPDHRGQGYGIQLMKRAEQWALEQGFSELGSDTDTHNHASIAAHKHLGFEETYRIVCFLKQLKPTGAGSSR